MKKNNLLMLTSAFLMGLSITSCGQTQESSQPVSSPVESSKPEESSSVDPVAEATATITEAAEYLWQMYKAKNDTELKGDLQLVTVVVIGGTKVAVEWKVTVLSGVEDLIAIKPIEGDANHVTLYTGYEEGLVTAETKYELSATLSLNGVSKTLEEAIGESKSKLTLTTPTTSLPCNFASFYGLTAPKVGSFFFALNQVNKETPLYATGEINSSEYMLTTSDPTAANVFDLVATDKEGEYQIKFAGKYLEVYENASKKSRIHYVDTPTANWKWDADLGLFTFDLVSENVGGTYYLGTYNTYDTISASKTSYISGDNKAKVGVSQFPAWFGLLKEAPAAGNYNLYTHQNGKGETLFVTGTLNSSEYLLSSTSLADAAKYEIKVAEDGGYYIVLNGKYLEIYNNASSKTRPTYVDAPTASWKWDADLGVLTFDVAGTLNYLGTYSTYNTISPSKTSYISGDNKAKIGESQYPLYLMKATTITAAEEEPAAPVDPFASYPAATVTVKHTIDVNSGRKATAEDNLMTIFGLDSAKFASVTQSPATGTSSKDGSAYSNDLGLYSATVDGVKVPEIRLYSGNTTKGSLEFTVTDAYTIKGLVIQYTSGSATDTTITCDGTAVTGVNTENVYYYAMSGQSVKLAATSAQVKILSIGFILEAK